MSDHTPEVKEVPTLLAALWELLQGARSAFGQERVFRRAVALVFGELFALGRHTVTQLLRALGEEDQDWSAWYRLLRKERWDEAKLAGRLVEETVQHVSVEEPYVVTLDAVRIYRTGKQVAGSGWWPSLRTAVFRRGLERAQRFVEGAWLTPVQEGYSRAVPLRWLPAVTAKSVASQETPCTEWEAGVKVLTWLRAQLDQCGRFAQRVLAIGDGAYDTNGIWPLLPKWVALLVRCSKNRALYALAEESAGTRQQGRHPQYGPRQPAPRSWSRKRKGWSEAGLLVRGRVRHLQYRVLGPYLVEGAADQPVFLLVIRGCTRLRGQRQRHYEPRYYLVSAQQQREAWVLPWPAETLLAWLWQRWECEVAHREMKSSLGIGDKQCWSAHSALLAVQWGVWVYGLLVLAAYRVWGPSAGPRRSGRWYRHAARWSFATLWQAFREQLWSYGELRPLYTACLNEWLKIETWKTGLWNAVASAAKV